MIGVAAQRVIMAVRRYLADIAARMVPVRSESNRMHQPTSENGMQQECGDGDGTTQRQHESSFDHKVPFSIGRSDVSEQVGRDKNDKFIG